MNPSLPKSNIVIAIDGYSSCGKSTLAKQLASSLKFVFIDTGAMYRAVTLYIIRNHIDLSDIVSVSGALDLININFQNIQGSNTTFLNGENVETEIRSSRVSGLVSEVAAISLVRQKLVAIQRAMGENQNLVMDGRDIGTVVFPDASVKFFITADPIVRAQRRYNEMLSKNQQAELHEVITNLRHRDTIDTTREDSPLQKADDAHLLDNTNLTIEEQFESALDIIRNEVDLSDIYKH
ncbi:MAG: (d)CMP kinase [Saprospiraceae bacterium]